MNPADLWERLGSLEDDQALQVLTQLFALYEQRVEQDPEDQAAGSFFQLLAATIDKVHSCNVSRR